MAKLSSCSRPRLLALYQSAPSPLCLGVQEKEEVELALCTSMTHFLGQFWRKSSVPFLLHSPAWHPVVGQHLQRVSGTSAHSSSWSRARKNAAFKAVLCDCGCASPGPSLRHCFWKKKLKKNKIQKLTPIHSFSFAGSLHSVCQNASLVSCCWFWSGIMKVGLAETQG